jgi:competence protein ComEC
VFNAPGDEGPAEEYVCLVNQTDEPVDLLGWLLRDGAGQDVNTLPDFTLAPEARVRVHPGKGRNSATDLFGISGSPVWNNEGDSVTLLDADGEEIDSQSYGPRDDDAASRCG